MQLPEVIKGEIFCDARGRIASVNGFNFSDVKRMYVVHHPSVEVVRGWNGHQFERKWFFCSAGAFQVALVAIDDWPHPSDELVPNVYTLHEGESELLCVPGGYASCLKAVKPGSTMVIFSDRTVEESMMDSYKFDSHRWIDWSITK